MATLDRRMSMFITDRLPPADLEVEVLCRDHVGTYVLPFPCRYENDSWRNAQTDEPIEVQIVGWREMASGSAAETPAR